MSKPRTARLDRIRSTMLGSSSTTRAQVLRRPQSSPSCVRSPRSLPACGSAAPGPVDLGLDRQDTLKQVPLGSTASSIRPPCACTMPVAMDRPRPAPGVARGRRAGSNGAAASSGGRPGAVVEHADDHLGRPGLGRHPDLRSRRVVAERVVQQVHEDLLHPVVVGPHHRQAGSQVSVTSLACSGGRQAIAASITSRMSHQSRCRRMMPDSIAEKSSRSSTSRPRRADSAAIRSRKRCWESRSQVTSGCIRLDA